MSSIRGGAVSDPNFGLPLTERPRDRLKAAGYVTGLFGKWHLGTLRSDAPA